jgi:actin related protein 2/3 complex subunit 5
MSPLLQNLYASPNGSELCDTLMKYLYKGMAQGTTGHTGTGQGKNSNVTPQATGFSQAGGRNFGGHEGGGQGMAVLLSWHEKVCCSYIRKVEAGVRDVIADHLVQLVEMVGPGSIVRVMSDRRTV